MSEYYDHTTYPAAGAKGTSAAMRAELELIDTGLAKLPTLAGNGAKAVVVNALATALTVTVGTLALAGNFATTGAYNTTLVQQASTTVTLPTTNSVMARTDAAQTFTGVQTFSSQPILSSLTASQAVFTDGSKGLVSNAVTGTGNVVMSNDATLVAPALGTPASGVATNLTGTAAGLTAGTVTTNANLTGHVTSVGNAAVLGSFSVAQLNTALSDGDVVTGGGSWASPGAAIGTGTPVAGTFTTGLFTGAITVASAADTIKAVGSTHAAITLTAAGTTNLDADTTMNLRVGGSTVFMTALNFSAAGAATFYGTVVNMTTSGTTLTVGVGADNGTVSAGVFTDRTKAFSGDALAEIRKIKSKAGHIDHDTLPVFARENVRKQSTDAEGNVTETIVVERSIGAMVSIHDVALQELDARIAKMEKP